jgi:NTE family protein
LRVQGGTIALVLSGGVGLGAYQAGAYAALQDRGLTPQWLAGSSAGAVNAALIAGTRPENRVSALRTFWMGEDALFAEAFAPFAATTGWRHLQNWMKAIEARLFGARGHFRPRFLTHPFEPLSALYDLAPMRQRIERLVDFDRLNGGDIRIAVATTEIDTGEMVIFDTGQGARIGVDHLLAICGSGVSHGRDRGPLAGGWRALRQCTGGGHSPCDRPAPHHVCNRSLSAGGPPADRFRISPFT